jgi:hypothetical protein
LKDAEIGLALRCFEKWLEVTARYEKHPHPVDPSHSALLRRLVSGKDVLPFPPPKRFSYQAYDLAEGKAMGARYGRSPAAMS